MSRPFQCPNCHARPDDDHEFVAELPARATKTGIISGECDGELVIEWLDCAEYDLSARVTVSCRACDHTFRTERQWQYQ